MASFDETGTEVFTVFVGEAGIQVFMASVG